MSQRTLGKVVREFLELQIAQNTIAALDIPAKMHLLQSWNDGMERSRHDRDQHGRYWDSSAALECQRRLEGEVLKAKKKFYENQNGLCELKNEVVALMIASR